METPLDSLAGLAWTQLWQVTAVALVVGALAWLVGRHRPHLAYVLWLLVLAKCLTPPLWSSPLGVFSWAGAAVAEEAQPADVASASPQPSSPTERALNPVVPGPRAHSLRESPPPAGTSHDLAPGLVQAGPQFGAAQGDLPAPRWREALPLGAALVALWLAGALVSLAVIAVRMLRWQLIVRRSQFVDSGPLVEMVERLSQRFGLWQKVRVCVTSQPMGPAVLGIVRPVVLLPEVLVSERSVEQLQPIVAHELTHVRRQDTVVGLLQVLAQCVWWFHPLVWWANRAVCRERERCCDAEVVGGLECPPEQYAQGLLDVLRLERQLVRIATLPGMHPYQITRLRLETIMDSATRIHRRMPPAYWLVLLVGLLVLLPGAGAVRAKEAVPTATVAKAAEPPSAGRREPAPEKDARGQAAREKTASAAPEPTTEPSSVLAGVTAIHGLWQVASAEHADQEWPASVVRQMTFEIDQKTLIIRRGGEVIGKTSYTADAVQRPHLIKLTYEDQPSLGIWQREGEKLSLCLADANQPCPKKFLVGPEGGKALFELQLARYAKRPLYVMDVDGTNLRRLASKADYAQTGSPSWSPDGKRIACDAFCPAFASGFSPHSHVFAGNADGTGMKDLGDGAMPSWSPDGKRFALSRYQPNRGVWIMNADGTSPQLVEERGWGIRWNPRSNLVAYTMYDGGANLWVRDLDNAQARPLLTKAYQQIYWGLTWSPDGQWLAFKGIAADGQAELAAVHVEGEAKGFKTLLPKALPGADFNATIAWGGDGRRLLVSLAVPPTKLHKLYFLDFSQKAAPQILPGQDPAWDVAGMAWSPDGRKIALNIRPEAP